MARHRAVSPVRSGERTAFIALTALAFCVHLFFVTRNWNAGQLIGHEFRQTQTALAAQFIQRENNFSLAYPTPVLGKPWAIPMEFPLYQWTVVAVSNATHRPLAESGRTVTLLCFYLTLPALYLLLGQLGLPPLHRLPGLCLALACPVYIFYSRAFLIESMALMFAVWFLVSFGQTLRTHRAGWLAATMLCGIAAGLVKVTTFLMWLAPAAAYGAYCVWRDWPRGTRDGKPLRQTLLWAAGSILPACGTAVWWVEAANAIKARNPAGEFLTSENLQAFNFGSWPMRFSSETWRAFMGNWDHAVMPLGLMAAVAIVALVFARRQTGLLLAALGTFLLPQLVFPLLFSWHDYYFYAIALFWVVTVSIATHGIFSSRWPWLGWPLLLALLGGQLAAYHRGYFPDQQRFSYGGSHLTDVLRDMTPKESVLVIAGDDWSSIIPYYAQRRALMLRTYHEKDWALVDRAFRNLADEDVAALILVGDQRKNHELIRKAAKAFNIDPVLCFTYHDADVYVSAYHRANLVRKLQEKNVFGEVTLAPQPAEITPPPSAATPSEQTKPVPPGLWETIFKNVTPKPTDYNFAMGLDLSHLDGMDVIGAHPDATLWVIPPAGAKEILWEFGIYSAAYEKDGDRTDGVEFIIREKQPDGTEREVYRRLLDPVAIAADRGLQTMHLDYEPTPGARLAFMTRPNHNNAYDWAYWRKIVIK